MIYDGPIDISETTVLKFVAAVPGGAGGAGGAAGAAGAGGAGGAGGGTAALSVSATPDTTTFGTEGDIMMDTISVTLAATGEGSADAIIYYTLDATEVDVPAGSEATEQEVRGYTFTPEAVNAQWAASGHGMILDEPWRYFDEDGDVRSSCAKCHSAEGFLQYAATAGNADPAVLPLGLDCSACHSGPMGDTTWSDLGTYPALEDVLFPSGATQDLDGNSNMCITCHQGRESTVQVDEDIAACPVDNPMCDADCTPMAGAGGAGGASGCEGLGFLNIHYYAAGATFFGTDVQGGYEYAANTYVGQNMYPDHPGGLYNDCMECHMEDNTHLFVPAIASCSGGTCHGSPADFTDLAGKPSESYDAIQALLPALLTAIQNYAATTLNEPIEYLEDDYPYWFNASDGESYQFDATLLKGAYNYQTGLKDPGGYIHNGDYIQQILSDSIVDLGGTLPPGFTRPPTP